MTMLTESDLTPIGSAAYRRALALRDLTDAAEGPHAIQLLVHDAIAELCSRWGVGVVVYRGSPVVTVADNYEALGYAADAAARDTRYTRYVSRALVLRTHTSALLPGLLRHLVGADCSDILLACPGLVWRRDVIDRLHVGEPHQLDLWRLRANDAHAPLNDTDLVEMIEAVAGALLPGAALRLNETSHPYTEHGLEVEVQTAGGWVELLECGLAAPAVLARAGLDPASYSGLAMGIGLDRALMLRKGIDDIRLLRSKDPRVEAQMLNLKPYQPVSSQPRVKRDISIAVLAGRSEEELGDHLRQHLRELGLDEQLESVELLSRSPGDDLPSQARDRLGLQPGQDNLLLRLVIRHPTRTLTDAEANVVRDRAYASLHEGTRYQWSAPASPDKANRRGSKS
jgi:phenylalanyl-tRNA synthetase alpha chain